jgi:hypothetical protein
MKLVFMQFSYVFSSAFLLLSVLAAQAQTVPAPRLPATVDMAPMTDPWPAARERFYDIDNNPFNAWITNGAPNGGFSYGNARVQLIYDRAPGVPYFVGRIEASGLKPNFAYQIKLLGKPKSGRRGWGSLGDDRSNERIGYAGRWWCDSSHSTQTNFDDSHYVNFYKRASAANKHDVYGYQFMGDFVTDAQGRASVAISGQYSYHITWASWQGGIKDTFWANFSISGAPVSGGFYGYGTTAPSGSVDLFYEYEAGRPNPVVLPNGTYKCRMVLTEETFHNTSFLGGYWKGVLATEDFDSQGRPDSNPANDVTFAIGQVAPKVNKLSPTTASDTLGATRAFAMTYADGNGDLANVYFKVGEGLQCRYHIPSQRLFIRAKDGSWRGGIAPGTSQILDGANGALNCAATAVSVSGNALTVNWHVSPGVELGGATHAISGFADDLWSLDSGWKVMGRWTIAANRAPQNENLAPSQASSAAGAPLILTSVHSDADGAADIKAAYLKIGSSGQLWLYYDAVQNKIYLRDDANQKWLGGIAPGSSNTISNAQGSINCADTNVSFSGAQLSINWSLTAAPSWAGSRQSMALSTVDRSDARDGYEVLGEWNVGR